MGYCVTQAECASAGGYTISEIGTTKYYVCIESCKDYLAHTGVDYLGDYRSSGLKSCIAETDCTAGFIDSYSWICVTLCNNAMN